MDGTSIAFLRPVSGLDALSDESFLQSIVWRRSAPSAFVRAAKQGDIAAFCRKLQKHRFGSVRGSGRKNASSKRAVIKQSLWSRDSFDETSRTARLADLWESFGAATKKKRGHTGVKPKPVRSNGPAAGQVGNGLRQLAVWLKALDDAEPVSPVELLVLLEWLLAAGAEMPVDDCWRLWRTVLTASLELSTHLDSPQNSPQGRAARNDRKLLVQGELPWQAGLLFAEIRGADKLARRGRSVLRKRLLDDTDTDGTPEAELLERLSFWLAPFVRATQWGKLFRNPVWDENSAERFRLLVEKVAPFCRPDGRLVLSNGFRGNALLLLTSASQLAGWKEDSRPLKYLRTVEKTLAEKKKRPLGPEPRSASKFPVTQSDWARLACLRNNWSVDADTLVVAHHLEKPLIELTALGTQLFSGVWDIEVTVDGTRIDFDDGEWDCSCWFSDKDADFLELHLEVNDKLGIDRQILLSRRDHFVLFADVISGADSCQIDYVSRLPLVAGVRTASDVPTRECLLKVGGRSARVFPIALPADRVMSASGGCGPAEGCLELRQTARGGLYAPLVIDWEPRRRRIRADWKTLTVTEHGKRLKSNAASGHRLRLGDHQLLIYRSLTESGESRAFLGHHTSSESVVGRFDTKGEVELILQVE